MNNTYEDTEKETTISTKWKNPPTLADLKQNYEDAKIEQDTQVSKIDNWLNYLNITGNVKLKKIPGHSNVQPKIIRRNAEWRYPALSEPFLSTEDVFNVYPVGGTDTKRARQNQLVLNNQFNTKINKVNFIDNFVRASVNEGTIIVRVGWDSKYKEEKVTKPIYEFIPDITGKSAMQYQALMQLQQTNPEKYKELANEGITQAIETFYKTGNLVIPQQVGSEEVVENKLVQNHPTLEVCNYKNIIIDPSCEGDIDKAGFVIFNFETSKSELKKKADIYTNIDAIKINQNSPLNDPDYESGKDQSNFTFKDDARSKFIATEYWGSWDYNNTGIAEPIVATWVGDVLIRLEASPFPDGKPPFVVVPHMPVQRSLYGEPDGELLTDNQNIIGAVTRGMIDIMGKSAAGQTGYRKDFLDATNTKKFREGKDYSFNSTVDPRIGVYQHMYPEIPQSAYNMIQMYQAESESLSGVKAYNGGINSAALGDVAAGIRGALDASSRRELSILRRLAYGMVLVARKIISLNAVLLSDEEVIRITEEEFVTVKRDDLAGEYDIRLAISTAEEDNAKAQELAFMLQTGASSADPAEVRMIRAEIARLRKMPDLAKKIEEYEPQPDPIMQQKAMLELSLIQAQVEKELAIAKSHSANADLTRIEQISEQANAALTVAKTHTEQAKTRQIHSIADKDDLNYLEQESGVQQERDLQKIRGQAEAQTNMKIVEAMLKPKKDLATS